MAAKIQIGIKSRSGYLRHLSVVFAVELRLRIVTELYMRVMSPKQFYEEFGGGSPSRVDKNFKKLAKHGWLSLVRTEMRRDGHEENFYRATELAYFDADTWALLPYSIRVAFSWSSFRQIAERVREAIEGMAGEAGSTGDLSCVVLQLDQLGWKRVIDAVDIQFVSLYEEQKNAKLRISESGKEPIRASVFQFAFESPIRGERRNGPVLAKISKEPPVPFPVRLSKVFADEVCLGIVEETNEREMSAAQFRREFGGSYETINRQFKKLKEYGWLKQVRKRRGRGAAVEYFYKATGPVIRDDSGPWTGVSDSFKDMGEWKTFERLSGQVKEAMQAGTFDAREDRYLAWSLLCLDRQGWKKVTTTLHALRAFVVKEQGRAKVRMKKTGEQPIAVTVSLGAFESPSESAKEP